MFLDCFYKDEVLQKYFKVNLLFLTLYARSFLKRQYWKKFSNTTVNFQITNGLWQFKSSPHCAFFAFFTLKAQTKLIVADRNGLTLRVRVVIFPSYSY